MKKYFNQFLNIIFPARCIACGEIAVDVGRICGDCWQKIDFVSQQCCERCGVPFEYDVGEGVVCLSCEMNKTFYSRAAFLFKYGDISKNLIHKLNTMTTRI